MKLIIYKYALNIYKSYESFMNTFNWLMNIYICKLFIIDIYKY